MLTRILWNKWKIFVKKESKPPAVSAFITDVRNWTSLLLFLPQLSAGILEITGHTKLGDLIKIN